MFQQLGDFFRASEMIALALVFICCIGANLGTALIVIFLTRRDPKEAARMRVAIIAPQGSQSTGWLEEFDFQQGRWGQAPGNRAESSDARGREEGGCAPQKTA